MRVAPLLFALWLCLAGPASARDYELTPLVGLELTDPSASDQDLGDGASFGLVFGLPLSESTAFEMHLTRQGADTEVADELDENRERVDVHVDHLHFGGVYQGGDARDRVRGFVTVSAGVTHFEAPDGFDGKTGLSGAIGGGFRLGMGDRTRARFQLRWISTDADSAGSIECQDGTCAAVADGSIGDLELSAGFTFTF